MVNQSHIRAQTGRKRRAVLVAGLLMLPWPALAQATTEAPPPAPARGLPDDQLSPLSLQMLTAGHAALKTGNTADAICNYEAALAADPRNRQAYIGLARASEADGLPGHALRYYREALALDPNDLSALELQGMAFLQRGAQPRAETNLERLKKLCPEPCPTADRLAAAITAQAAKKPAAKPQPTTPAPDAASAVPPERSD